MQIEENVSCQGKIDLNITSYVPLAMQAAFLITKQGAYCTKLSF